MGHCREMLYFAFRNRKLVIGLSIVGFFLLVAIIGPYFAQHAPLDYGGALTVIRQRSVTVYYLGTTSDGQ